MATLRSEQTSTYNVGSDHSRVICTRLTHLVTCFYSHDKNTGKKSSRETPSFCPSLNGPGVSRSWSRVQRTESGTVVVPGCLSGYRPRLPTWSLQTPTPWSLMDGCPCPTWKESVSGRSFCTRAHRNLCTPRTHGGTPRPVTSDLDRSGSSDFDDPVRVLVLSGLSVVRCLGHVPGSDQYLSLPV